MRRLLPKRDVPRAIAFFVSGLLASGIPAAEIAVALHAAARAVHQRAKNASA